jgi:two-component system NarL family sensor kinase
MPDDVLLAAGFLFGTSALASAWFLLRGSRSRWSAGFLGAGGAAVLLAGCLVLLGAQSAAAPLYAVTGVLLVPLAQVGYPAPELRRVVPFLATVTVVGAGVTGLAWPTSREGMGYVLVAGLGAAAWWHFEFGDVRGRRAVSWAATTWATAGVAALFVGFLTESVQQSTNGPAYSVTAVLLLCLGPPAMVVGVVRPDVVDVRGLVTGLVVGVTTFVVFLAVALGLAAAFEMAGGGQPGLTPTVVMCGVLAFGVRPLVVMLRGVVDQLLFGDRPEPLVAATQMANRIGDDPVLALRAVREALVLPYASLRAEGQELAASGTPVTHTRSLPLRLGDDTLGEVVVGLRAGDLSLARDDEDVLRIVAPLLAQTLRSRAMAADLQASRGAAIAAIEEERRRLRRDLHDGLGPTLTGVAFAADAARNQLGPNPAAAEALLVRLRGDVADAVAEVRRLVEGLWPPVLDQLGLVAAVRQHASGLHTAEGQRIPVTVVAPDDLPRLPAATEVAAYRIVVEALTNVARHAAATTARVELAVEGTDLRLLVQDDGSASTPWEGGVGMSSMREPAEQVGGRLEAAPVAGGGRVCALIPL